MITPTTKKFKETNKTKNPHRLKESVITMVKYNQDK